MRGIHLGKGERKVRGRERGRTGFLGRGKLAGDTDEGERGEGTE